MSNLFGPNNFAIKAAPSVNYGGEWSAERNSDSAALELPKASVDWGQLKPHHFKFSEGTTISLIASQDGAPSPSYSAVRVGGSGKFQSKDGGLFEPFTDGAILVSNGQIVRMIQPELILGKYKNEMGVKIETPYQINLQTPVK